MHQSQNVKKALTLESNLYVKITAKLQQLNGKTEKTAKAEQRAFCELAVIAG